MKILQGGAPKCGNFWLYQILQESLKAGGMHASSFIEKQPIYQLAKNWDLNYPSQASIDVIDITDLQTSYRISSIYRMPISSMEEYLSQTSHVWTHSPVCKRSEDIFRYFTKKIYIIRDPRDRAISASKYYCSDYMLKYYPQEETEPQKFLDRNFNQLMEEWIWHVFDHLRLMNTSNIHIVFYENFLNHFEEEYNNLLDYLEVSLNPEDLKRIQEKVSFARLRQENPKHLKTGKAGYWREKLSPEQKEKAERIAGPLMDYLGYNATAQTFLKLPANQKEADFDELREQIISSLSLTN